MRAKPYFLTVLVRTEEESGFIVGDEIFVQVRPETWPGLVRIKKLYKSVSALTTIKDFKHNQSGGIVL